MRPVQPNVVRDTIQHHAENNTTFNLGSGVKGVMIALLNEAVDGDDNRHKVLDYLFGVSSTKYIDSGQWVGLWRWIMPYKDEDEQRWMGDRSFYIEAKDILSLAQKPPRTTNEILDDLGLLKDEPVELPTSAPKGAF